MTIIVDGGVLNLSVIDHLRRVPEYRTVPFSFAVNCQADPQIDAGSCFWLCWGPPAAAAAVSC